MFNCVKHISVWLSKFLLTSRMLIHNGLMVGRHFFIKQFFTFKLLLNILSHFFLQEIGLELTLRLLECLHLSNHFLLTLI